MSVGMVGRNTGPCNSPSLNCKPEPSNRGSDARITNIQNQVKHKSDGSKETPVLKMSKPDGTTHVLYRSAEESAAAASRPAPDYFRSGSAAPEKTVLKIYGPDGRERGYSKPEPSSDNTATTVQAADHVHETGPGGCKTCAERLYQDRSGDSGVSFQNPGHISPSASLSMVSSHEMEHVVREARDARANDQMVIAQSVQIHLARCPECNRTYAAGGETKIAKMKVVESQSSHSADTPKPRFDKAI